ncbi:hypothetical protein CI610_03646 [invertebrate metagenome]|uniref:Uncharacterized protein n=1 Tax=invertebrate metagenome TaxID=1711999 RepID=A0A2H9T2I1_9ZZZZ
MLSSLFRIFSLFVYKGVYSENKFVSVVLVGTSNSLIPLQFLVAAVGYLIVCFL